MAELAWLGDEIEAEIQIIRHIKTLANTPRQSLAFMYFMAMQKGDPKSRFMVTISTILKKYKIEEKGPVS